jgi:spore maturation protein CgeB
MRILKLSTLYEPALAEALDGIDPDASADAMETAIADFRFGTSDFHVQAWRAMGFEAWEVTWMPALIRRRGKELGMSLTSKDLDIRVIHALILELQPDVVFVHDLFLIGRRIRDAVRAVRPRPKVVGWQVYPPYVIEDFADVDLLLSSSPEIIARFNSTGTPAALWDHGFEPRMHTRHSSDSPDIPFAFFGTLAWPGGPHARRYELVRMLMGATPLEAWVEPRMYEKRPRERWIRAAASFGVVRMLKSLGIKQHVIEQIPKVRWAARWHTNPLRADLAVHFPDRVHPAALGRAYLNLLGRTSIVLNTHEEAGRDAMNMRDFEATGMGACLLTDETSRVVDYFDPGTEIITYKDPRDAVKKYRDLTKDPEHLAAVAEAGRRRTHRDHTYAARACEFISILERSQD